MNYLTQIKQRYLSPQVLFTLLPIALCTGRASEAGGIYFFAALFPLFLHRENFRFIGIPLFRLGIIFLGLFYIFPLDDLLQLLFRGAELSETNWTFKEIMNGSRFSSSLGMTGIFFLIFSFVCDRQSATTANTVSIDIFRIFTMGLTAGLLLLSIYVGLQFATGFNFSQIAEYRPDRQMGSIFYRATGFANHPVSFAGFSLVIFAFYLAYFFSTPFSRVRELLSKCALTIVILTLAFIFMSGSRMAVLTALLLLTFMLFFSKQYARKSRFIVFSITVGLGTVLTFASGMHIRFLEIFAEAANSGFGDRKFFWQVHWQMFKDSPWIGNGHYFVDHYFRPNYYYELGFQDLVNKYNAHNIYLEVLADLGIIGAAVLTIFLITAMKLIQRALKNEDGQLHYRCFMSALIASLLFGLTQNSFFDSPTMLVTLGFLWMMFWHQNYAAGIS